MPSPTGALLTSACMSQTKLVETARVGQRDAGLIELAQQRAAVFEAVERDRQPHVVLQIAADTGIEGGVSSAEAAGRIESAERHRAGLRRRVDGARQQEDVGG